MTSAYSINLNFNNTIPVKTDFTFKQGDKGIILNLATTGLDTTGTTAKIVFKRSNGTSVEAELTGQTGPSYSYTILGNEFEIPGVVVADLKLYNGDTQRVSTASFIFLVTGDTMDGVGGGTGGYSDQLEQLSQEFEDTLTQYEEAFADVGAVHAAGNYDPTTEYSPLDLVYYSPDNSTYLCVEGCTGETPSPSSQYWQLVVDGSSLSTPDFDDLGDVDMTGVQNGQVPTYNSTTQKYEPGNGGGGGSAADITYDNTTSKLSATRVQGAIDETVSQIKNAYAVGGKNKNRYPYYETTKESNGITYTDNGDGTITVSGIATGDSNFRCNYGATNNFRLKAGSYIISGCPSGGSASTFYLVCYTERDTGSGATVTMSQDDYVNITLAVKSGTNLTTPIIFRPMVRDASDPDGTWCPYGKSLIQLTEDKAEKTDLTSIIATGSTNTTGAQIPNGAYFYLNGVFCQAIADIATNATFTKNTNYIETTVGERLGSNVSTATVDLSSYTNYNAPYTFGADGYLLLAAKGSSSLAKGILFDAAGNDIGAVAGLPFTGDQNVYNATRLFVRKGMKFCVDVATTGATVLRFYAF